MKNLLMVLIAMGLVGIAGCGKRGRLFTPGPDAPYHYPGQDPLCPAGACAHD